MPNNQLRFYINEQELLALKQNRLEYISRILPPAKINLLRELNPNMPTFTTTGHAEGADLQNTLYINLKNPELLNITWLKCEHISRRYYKKGKSFAYEWTFYLKKVSQEEIADCTVKNIQEKLKETPDYIHKEDVKQLEASVSYINQKLDDLTKYLNILSDIVKTREERKQREPKEENTKEGI